MNEGMGERIDGSFRGVIAAGIVAGAAGASFACVLLLRSSVLGGLIVAAITFFLFRWFWRATLRKRELLRRGYFAGSRVGTHWAYQELHAGEVLSLEFPLEYVGRGEYDLRVPGEAAWSSSMPAWARDRRAEILERLLTVFKRSQIHTDPDAQ